MFNTAETQYTAVVYKTCPNACFVVCLVSVTVLPNLTNVKAMQLNSYEIKFHLLDATSNEQLF
jgi:hypothetical protein